MEVLKDMFGSKKHVVALITILIVALNRKLSLGLTEQEVKLIVATAGALIIGQGAADLGKGKFEAETKQVEKASKFASEREKIKKEIQSELEGK